MVEKANYEGWDWFEKEEEVLSKKEKDRLRQAEKDFFHLFASEQGQRVMACLERRTIMQSTLPQQAIDGATVNTLMAVRAGENNMVLWMKSMIEKGGQPNE